VSLIWDRYQLAVFDDFARGQGHTVVIARAGSGKTSTLIAGLDYLPAWGTVLLTAFNKGIELELKARAPSHVRVRTLHGLGFSALRQHFGREVDIDEDKGRRIAYQVLNDFVNQSRMRLDIGESAPMLRQLASLAKNCLVRDLSDIEALAYAHGLESFDFPAQLSAPLVAECLKRASATPKRIDFDDMVYLPAKLGATPAPFDFVLVDEAQDLNVAQLYLSTAACKGRLGAIGDPRQGIYQFRGADSAAISRIVHGLGAKVLPLSVTYRCSLAIIAHVQSRVSGLEDLEPRPGAPQGAVEERRLEELLGPFGARPGDFILSRLNAPLMPICMHFLRHGIPAVVAGRDIGRNIGDLAKKSGAHLTKDMLVWLENYRQKEYDRLVAADKLERYVQIQDQIDAVRVLAEGTTHVAEVIAVINTIFSDDKPTGAIVCSTVHRAKGLERDRVWLLSGTFFLWDGEEEDNLYYVACTRAKNTLFLVPDGVPTADSIRTLVEAE
jgi:DNA helicase-2/ATP-dependent DNA helicase PcrA